MIFHKRGSTLSREYAHFVGHAPPVAEDDYSMMDKIAFMVILRRLSLRFQEMAWTETLTRRAIDDLFRLFWALMLPMRCLLLDDSASDDA